MAVQPSTGRTVPLYALIIFIVLFVASVTTLVILFLNQEELRQQADRATKKYKDYIGSANLEPYAAKAESIKPRTTAAGALLAERDALAKLLTGNPDATPEQVNTALNEMLKRLPPEAETLKDQAKVDLVGAVAKAVVAMRGLSDQVDSLRRRLKESDAAKETVTKAHETLKQAFAQSSQQIQGQLSSLESRFEQLKRQHTEQLQGIENKVGADLKSKLDTVEKAFKEDVEDLRAMVRRNLQSLIQSMKELGPAEQRQKATLTVEKLTQRHDGQVLSVAGDVIYLAAGGEHKVKPGMRFYVYSKLEKGAVRPKPKAVVEVTAIGELTSESRAILAEKGAPILPGDLIGNLVYDRDLALKLFVLGDFDFNADGLADPNGPQRVAEIVTSSGGTVVRQLSPNVDFVVLGAEPKVPPAPAFGAGEAAEAEHKKQQQRHRDYLDVKDQAQALAIPLISPETFMTYTGYSLGAN